MNRLAMGVGYAVLGFWALIFGLLLLAALRGLLKRWGAGSGPAAFSPPPDAREGKPPAPIAFALLNPPDVARWETVASLIGERRERA